MKKAGKFHWVLLAILALAATAFSQTTASIKGTVTDSTGAAVVGAKVTVTGVGTGIVRTADTDTTGSYEVPALPPGKYAVKIEKGGFQAQQTTDLQVEVSQNAVQNFSLKVASASEVVTVEATAPVVETTTVTVGQTITQRTVQELPLNGRHFVDLALLVPGTVTAPQNGFLTAPLRGQGAFAVNTAGMREDAVNWMVNGINLNDMVQNQVTFQPTVNTVGEFKVDNSTYSAEYGRNAGAIVTIASRSGTNQFHGEVYDYIRNDFFDARNAFNPKTTSAGAPLRENPFKRNQFGGDIGGPIWKDKTFFFMTYEGERHRQGLATSSNVFTPTQLAQIAASPSATVRALGALVPGANGLSGTSPAFLGSATAPVNIDQGTADINHTFSEKDRVHGYYVYQHDLRQEPTAGTNLPGFGDTREGHRQVFTVNETHVFTPALVNELNLGVNRILITFTPNTNIDPSSLGLAGILGPNQTFMPTISITGGPLFGAERGFPQGRGDTMSVVGDNVSWIIGRHSLKFGGEFRDFRNANFNGDPGQLVFNNFTDFINGTVDSAARTIGNVANRIGENAVDFYGMDSFKFRPNFTIEAGVRYAWNMSPTEGQDRFVNFVPGGKTGSMLVPTSEPYAQNINNVQPRVGFIWDLRNNGKTVLRSGIAYQVDQPITNLVTGLSSNPPFALPISLTFSTPTPFSALTSSFNGTPSSVSPIFVDPNYKDASVISWNLNVQQELTPKTSFMIGYFGNKGTHLEDDINLNQTTVLGQVAAGNAALPFVRLSSSSPFLAGVPLGSSLTGHMSGSTSIYNALWVTATQKTSHGVQFNMSYTYSHSIDDVSRNQGGVTVQDSTNIFSSRGNSDFDVRQRFVGNAIYDLPFKGNRFKTGWEIAPIITYQTGNPYNIVVSNSAQISGVGNSVRPNVTGTIFTSRNPQGSWIVNPAVFSAIPNAGPFGNLGRNDVYGPGFANVDMAVAKNTKISERLNLQFRVDAFDLLNHPNYGQPGPQGGGFLASVFSPGAVANGTFGAITSTRFPTGDSGSSRQLQMALKLQF